ncbi:Photosystem II PsbP [Macleaya cordata]|uniref:Photosystem II PsbP n=1 Tax=Macleaya cordata TaxID=56857 RepID=A0A200PUV3_MACCD|nr:Photosystem II PsbP [Macleaya cordata]
MMSTTLFTSCSFSFKYDHKSPHHFTHSRKINRFHHNCAQFSLESGNSRTKASTADSSENRFIDDEDNSDENKFCGFFSRRAALISGVSLVSSAVLMGFPTDGLAVVKQGLLAGRVPGLSEPDEQGWRTYRRPDEKSGGHGVGWSPIIPYSFSVPQDWEEVPVSIADLGGTEIDLRFASSQAGRLFVIVAPVLRFADDLGDDVKIEMIGPPDKVINAFGPEVIGENVEGKVLSMEVAEHSGRKYYQYELEPPHVLISTTAAGNRLYLFAVTANESNHIFHYTNLVRPRSMD